MSLKDTPARSALPVLSSHHLSVLISVAETGSFSEAALRLGVAQSSVSHAVSGLETQLARRVFERGRHGARLTPAGVQVLAQARLAAEALRAMRLGEDGLGAELPGAERASPEVSGTLHVVSCRSVIRHFLTPALNGFKHLYPQAQVILHDTSGEHDDIERMVLSGEANLGLGRLPMRPALRCRALFADEYLIISAVHQPRLTTWDALHRAAFIVCQEDCAPYVAAHIAHHSHPPTSAVRLKDAQVALGMVAEGHGFTVLSSLVVCPLPSGLQAYPLPVPLWRTIGSVIRAEQSNPLINAFRDVALSPAALRWAAGPLEPLLRFPAYPDQDISKNAQPPDVRGWLDSETAQVTTQ